jgi:hypothetical protein
VGDPFGTAELFGDEEDEADVAGDGAVGVVVVVEIVAEALEVAVENEAPGSGTAILATRKS